MLPGCARADYSNPLVSFNIVCKRVAAGLLRRSIITVFLRGLYKLFQSLFDVLCRYVLQHDLAFNALVCSHIPSINPSYNSNGHVFRFHTHRNEQTHEPQHRLPRESEWAAQGWPSWWQCSFEQRILCIRYLAFTASQTVEMYTVPKAVACWGGLAKVYTELLEALAQLRSQCGHCCVYKRKGTSAGRRNWKTKNLIGPSATSSKLSMASETGPSVLNIGWPQIRPRRQLKIADRRVFTVLEIQFVQYSENGTGIPKLGQFHEYEPHLLKWTNPANLD